MPEEFYIDSELIKKVPTEMLIAELKRRMNEFIGFCADLLKNAADRPEAPWVVTPALPRFNMSEELALCDKAIAEATSNMSQAAARLQDDASANRFSKAREAGLAVPVRRTDADLQPGHFPTPDRTLPEVMRDPERRAAMNDAVAKNYATPEARALQDELRASGQDALADEMTRMPDARTASMMAPPSLQQVVAANKRNAADAFVQPILPPSLAGAVRAPTITEIGWFDNPDVVVISLEDLLTNRAAPRPGIPTPSAFDIGQRVKELTKTLKGTLAMLKTDGFTGHLPAPVVRVQDDSLTMLLEPVVIWRLLLHLGPRLPFVHVEENLRTILNTHISEKVAEDEQVLLVGSAATMPGAFREGVTSKLMGLHRQARNADKPKIAQAIKRQIRILNPEFSEMEIPDERTADLMKLTDPRKLREETQSGPGTMIGPKSTGKTAQIRALREEISSLEGEISSDNLTGD